nr:DNA helicase [Tanacetum cinerariifolium]
MTSLGANVDSSVNKGKGPYVFRVSGLIYHWIGSMWPDEGQPPRFLQLYIHDTANEVNNRMANFGNEHESVLKKEIVKGLIQLLDSHNALVQLFRTARNKYMEADIPEFKVRLYNVIGTRQYELPTAETIGAIVFAETLGTENDFDLIIEEHLRFPQRVNKLHPCYMSLQFPLLFIYGEDVYHTDTKLANIPSQTTKANKHLSMNMYYSYQIHDRLNNYSLILQGGRLYQQYVVTAYCAIEQSRLDYIRQKQSDIRNEYLSGIYDAILRGDRDANNLGLHTVLTASFTGGPRYMYAHYLDALAICHVHGSPSFFITFTCNTKWPEIEEFMEPFPQLTTTDRVDIVDRVFEKKVRDYIAFVRDSNTFSDVTAVLYTIEFQKRGLPHCHSLLWIDTTSKVNQAIDVDLYVSAELPNLKVDANRHRIISELMIHGPCGYANRNASCMKDGSRCNRNFPKAYYDKTPTATAESTTNVPGIQVDEIKIMLKQDTLGHTKHVGEYWIFQYIIVTHLFKLWRSAIGRLIYIHPSAGDLFYERILLCHQKGCKSFLHIRTVNGTIYQTNKAACEALGLIGGDEEWTMALQEAADFATAS